MCVLLGAHASCSPRRHEDAKKSQRTFFASSCLRGEIFLVAALLLVFICVHLWFHFVQSRNKFGLCCRAERGWRGASDGRYLARRVMSEQQRRSGLRPQPGGKGSGRASALLLLLDDGTGIACVAASLNVEPGSDLARSVFDGSGRPAVAPKRAGIPSQTLTRSSKTLTPQTNVLFAEASSFPRPARAG